MPKGGRVVGVGPVPVSMCQHTSKRDRDLSKSRCGLRNPLHPWNRSLRVVHLVVNDTEELGRAPHRLHALAMVDSLACVLVVNMARSIIY
jgi:hypothetical protein